MAEPHRSDGDATGDSSPPHWGRTLAEAPLQTDPDITARVRAKALALGFHRVGFAAVAPLDPEHDRYTRWLAEGHHGEMAYMADNVAARRRVDGPEILPGARTVIVCAASYHRPDEPGLQGATIARYARGRDYHNFVRRRLRRLAAWMRATFGAECRPMVDTAPVLERAWAARAGVGFVGKNGCVIAPGLGSYLLLGEVVTDLALTPDAPVEPRCGQCTLCLDRCPTQAFAGPYVLDARRCVSYLTIELAGSIPAPLRAPIGDRIFGCDDCQSVCPFNRTAPPPAESTEDFEPDPEWKAHDPSSLLTLHPHDFAVLTHRSAIQRAGRDTLRRNAAVVIGNTGDRRHLPVLRHIETHDTDGVVREAARWAAAQIEAREGPAEGAEVKPKVSEEEDAPARGGGAEEGAAEGANVLVGRGISRAGP